MYTSSVRLRLFACAFALLFAVTPLMGLICQLDCRTARAAAATAPCHETAAADKGSTTVRGTHGCTHDHGGDGPALLTSASAPDMSVAPVATLSVLVPPLLSAAQAHRIAMHGPPGFDARLQTSLTTVLRI